ncbi:hypothetical protein RF11_05651 [Thelohanellus kitauei]|uniref:Uncharacterized protein n=1 Tax=Thelohanellus kitauei TaxID=669202 RepID=A0A0C2MTQ6_THEKT|nr:hypothetical protein RF11_05651 [Thelohanellus kitauei]
MHRTVRLADPLLSYKNIPCRGMIYGSCIRCVPYFFETGSDEYSSVDTDESSVNEPYETLPDRTDDDHSEGLVDNAPTNLLDSTEAPEGDHVGGLVYGAPTNLVGSGGENASYGLRVAEDMPPMTDSKVSNTKSLASY